MKQKSTLSTIPGDKSISHRAIILGSLATNKSELISAIPTIQPIKNKDLTRVASGFGYRIDPFTKKRRFHYGMDFTAKRGTPIT